ncbi:MAG: polymorphic toxin type 4 domain-containing protein, partial [Pseudonocardiaceae bacterium]
TKGKGKQSGMRIIGRLVIYDKVTGELVSDAWRFQLHDEFIREVDKGTPIRSGVHPATVTVTGSTVFLKWKGHELDLNRFSSRDQFLKDVRGETRMVLVLNVPGGTLVKEGYEAGKLPPGAQVDEGAGGGGQGPTDKGGGGGASKNKPGAGSGGGSGKDKPGGGSGIEGGTATEGGGEKGGTAQAKDPIAPKTRVGGKEGGKGTGDRPGSKYGWLGWLELDQDTIDALEAVFEAMGDSEEFLALQQTLQALVELAEHADQLPALLAPDELVKLVLGIESPDTKDIVAALEKWVAQDTRPEPAGTDPSRKGIAAMAAKLLKLVRKLRKALRPVFAARATFQAVFGVLQSVLAEVDSFALLLAHLQGPALSADALGALTRRIGREAATRLVNELREARAEVALVAEKFTHAELLHREDIARAIVAGAAMATPKLYKPIVWVLQKTDVDRLVADNLVDKLIPTEAVTAINDALLAIAAPLTDAVKNLAKHLDAVFDAGEKVAAEKIPAAIEAALPVPAKPVQRADNPTLLGGHLATLSGTAVKGLVGAMPKKGDKSLSKAADEVEAWLARNEKRPVVSGTDPPLPAKYYKYFPSNPPKKPRVVVRTPIGIVAGVPQLMIYKGRIWRKGRIIAEGRDALGQLAIRSELGPPPGRQGFEQLLPLGTEVLDQKGWERAHSQGQVTGAESAEGIRLAPRDVNQKLQRIYVEGRLAEIVRERAPGVRVLLTTETTTWPGTLRLQKIQYTVRMSRPGESAVEMFFAWISVSDSLDSKVDFGTEMRPGWTRLDDYLEPRATRLGGGTKRTRKKGAKK